MSLQLALCYVVIPLDKLASIVSIFSVMALSLDRYFACVCNSSTYARWLTMRIVLASIGAIWLYAFSFSASSIPFIRFDTVSQHCLLHSGLASKVCLINKCQDKFVKKLNFVSVPIYFTLIAFIL